MLTIVSATTHDEASFHKDTFLGTSLSRLRKAGLDFDTRIIFRNPSNVGLPEVYNRAIGNDASSQQPMVLIHDDVSIEDALVEQKLQKKIGVRSILLTLTRSVNRATRDMDCKTVHMNQKRIRVDGKIIGMNRKKIDMDQKVIHMDRKTGGMSPSANRIGSESDPYGLKIDRFRSQKDPCG